MSVISLFFKVHMFLLFEGYRIIVLLSFLQITEPFKPPDALKPTEIPKPTETPKKVEPLKPSVLSTPKTLPLELPTNGVGGTLPAEPPHVTIDPSPLSPDKDEKAKMEQTEEEVLRCFVLMLDLLIMQVRLHAMAHLFL